MTQKLTRWCLIACLVTMAWGCAWSENAAQREQRLAEIEQKKKNYAALRRALISHTLPEGTSDEQIEAQFGAPDGIFHSGSSVSSFEIWTYEYITGKDETADGQPIRLYIESGRLISWKY